MSFKATIEADIKGFTNNIDKAIGSVDKLEKTTLQKLSSIGNSFVSVGKRASILSVALVGVGAKAFSMAADFEDAMGATDQVFKTSSEEIQNWAKSLSSEYGVAKKEALEYANLMGTMLKNIGNLTEREASAQSKKLVELAGDLTAMYGGTTSEAINALTASLRGINVPITKYGVGINDALVKAKAFEMGISSLTGELSIQARQAATLQLIWDQTADAQGQAGREADTASGAMRAFKTEVANLSTEIGEVLLPIITPMITKLTEATQGFRGLSTETQTMIVKVAGAVAVAGPLLVAIGSILKVLPLIKIAIVALSGPIGWVAAAIVAATALIIANWDKLKAASNNVVEYIKDDWNRFKESLAVTSSSISKLMKADFSGWWEDVKKSFDLGIDYLKNRWEQLKGIFKDDKIGNPDQKLLEAALAANEMTGAMGDNKKAVEETVQPTIDLTKANEDLAKSQEKVVENLKAMRLVIPQKETYSLFNALFTQSGSELILNPVVEPNIDSATLKSKMYESVKSAMGDLSEGIQVITIDLTSMLSSTLTDMFGAVSNAIMNGDSVIDALGASLLGTLGGIMVELGQMVIVTGKAIEAVKVALKGLGGFGAIAAGAALIAIGSLFSAGARKLSNSMGGGGGGYSSAPSLRNTGPTLGNSEYRGAYRDDFKVEFKIGSNELVGVLDTANQRRNRLG